LGQFADLQIEDHHLERRDHQPPSHGPQLSAGVFGGFVVGVFLRHRQEIGAVLDLAAGLLGLGLGGVPLVLGGGGGDHAFGRGREGGDQDMADVSRLLLHVLGLVILVVRLGLFVPHRDVARYGGLHLLDQ